MTKVKICGLSTPETMQAALDFGADMVGLVFFARSPRNVSLQLAAVLAQQARGRAQIVALTVDADDTLLSKIIEKVYPDYIQAHGDETPERVLKIEKPVIKAIKVKDASDIKRGEAYLGKAAIILYDAKAPVTLANSLPGGNGLSFDWNLMSPVQGTRMFMLSGGLTPENVAQAVSTTRAGYVDVSSGVETTPGQKDVHLIRKFIEAAKAAR